MSGHFHVSVAVNTTETDFLDDAGVKVDVFPISIVRNVSPFRDIGALIELVLLFRRERFDVVHSIMPKSLMAMLAGWIAGVPVRVHVFTGQVWATKTGLARWILRFIDRFWTGFATHVLTDSESQRQFLIKNGVVAADKIKILAKGSICGVNLDRFKPNPETRAELRRSLGIAEEDLIFLFVGRLKKDKGILDLAKAFVKVSEGRQQVHLLIVGPDEENISQKILDVCEPCSGKVHLMGFAHNPEDYFAASDVFCLPSYREGFGTTIIEAAATGVPAIGTRIYGIIDSVESDVTGLLFNPGDIEALAKLMDRFAADSDLRELMGKRAMERAVRDFPSDVVVKAQLVFYESCF